MREHPLSTHLTDRYGRGFSERSLRYFRSFYLLYAGRPPLILQRFLAESLRGTVDAGIPQSIVAESDALLGPRS